MLAWMEKRKPVAGQKQKNSGKKTKVQIPITPPEQKSIFKNMFFYVFVILIGYLVFGSLFQNQVNRDERPISEVINLIREEKVQDVTLRGDEIEVLLKDGTTFYSQKEETISFDDILANNLLDPAKVAGKIEIKKGMVWLDALSPILSFLLPLVFILLIFRQMRGASGDILSFGKSRARLFSKDRPKITFKDVAGIKEAKEELYEIVDFLKNPDKYRKLGARIPKGILIVGPSGVGKTLLAKAIAGEAEVPFFSVAGSEFMEMLVGVGSARARDLFQRAKESQPSLIFIDEIDAIGRQRGMGIGGGHDEREQTLNQILIEMDGFDPRANVIVIAASVTGDTPILVKKNNTTQLTPIGDFVDSYYGEGESGFEVEAGDVQALSYESIDGIVEPRFTNVRGVFRYRAKEIYEIDYVGGRICTTGNHSLFVWDGESIVCKPASLLEVGDVLVDITPKRVEDIKTPEGGFERYVQVYLGNKSLENTYAYVMVMRGALSQGELAEQTGFAQTTVSLWHREINGPRALSRNYYKHELPEYVKVTPEFSRLLGYYTAEGYARREIDFCFNEREKEYIEDVKKLMFAIFGLRDCVERRHTKNAVNLNYQSTPVANLFKMLCGSGAKNKHVPEFLFEAPYRYFEEYLKGVFRGDGYQDRCGRLEITSVSERLIDELVWISRIHGVKAYKTEFMAQEGRRINNGKPLSAVRAFRIGLGKYYNPFNEIDKKSIKFSPRKARVVGVKKKSFNSYVYDLCGCANEAFFAGHNPILAHNTNRPDMLDPALIRPGRFDRKITIPMPDLKDREEIIKIHMQGKPFEDTVLVEEIAKRTVGFNGADIENMLNEAAILAARQGRQKIAREDVEEAAMKVTVGAERKTLQTEEERKMVAYHEAGHALVASNMPEMDKVHTISIVARGSSLGHTHFPPERDRYNETKTRLFSIIATMLGGRVAEELVFNEMTIGAADDINKATILARKMVTEYGMSALGPVSYDRDGGRVWLARELGEGVQYSEEVAAKIDAEIKKFIDSAYQAARKILVEKKLFLDKVAEVLLQKETVRGDEYMSILSGAA